MRKDKLLKPRDFKAYLKCPFCGEIISNPGRQFNDITIPLPCCGSRNKERPFWPSTFIKEYVKTVLKQDVSHRHGSSMAVILLYNMLEFFLKSILWDFLVRKTSSREVAMLTLSSHQGMENLIKLYNKINVQPMEKVFQSNYLAEFYYAWKYVIERWETLIQEKSQDDVPSTVNFINESGMIRIVVRDCFRSFSVLSNDITKQIEKTKVKEIPDAAKTGKVGLSDIIESFKKEDKTPDGEKKSILDEIKLSQEVAGKIEEPLMAQHGTPVPDKSETGTIPSILIVDDEEEQRTLLGSLLKQEGIDVYTTESGLEAVELYKKRKPKCVLLDVSLGDTDGLHVLKKIREADAGANVYFVTGVAGGTFLEEAKKLGAKGHFEKPIDIENLRKIITRL